MPQDPLPTPAVSWAAAARTWLLIGATGFGGPAGQIAILHREVVERKRWLGEDEFLAALRLCMLLPGPEAQQLATYAGWRLQGVAGAILAGTLFVLPGALLVTGLAWLHAASGSLPAVAAAFAGTRPAVVALVVLATWRIGRRSIKTLTGLAIAIAAVAAMAVGVSFPLVVVVAAIIGMVIDVRTVKRSGHELTNDPPQGVSAAAHDPEVAPYRMATLWPVVRAATIGLAVWAAAYGGVVAWNLAGGRGPAMAMLFTKTTLLSLGGAYAVVPWALDESLARGWLEPPERFDALAMGEATPGPLILVVTFIGFLAGWKTLPAGDPIAGVWGAAIATAFAFIPSFAMVLGLAPWVRSIHTGSRLDRALAAIGAVVVGALALLAVRLAIEAFAPGNKPLTPSALLPVMLSLACGTALLRGWLATPVVVLAAAAVGIVVGWLH